MEVSDTHKITNAVHESVMKSCPTCESGIETTFFAYALILVYGVRAKAPSKATSSNADNCPSGLPANGKHIPIRAPFHCTYLASLLIERIRYVQGL